MPRISSFYGIIIAMYFDDHGVPHFHAVYGGDECSIDIGSLAVLEGTIPNRAYRMVRTWAELHRAELLENWQRARAGEPLAQVDPLD